MGTFACCKRASEDTSSIFAPGEQEISFPEYESRSDSYFALIEGKYNLINHVQLLEFMNLLEAFSIETATIKFQGKYRSNFSSKDEFLSTTIHQDEFQSFIENKLLKLTEIYELSGKNEQMVTIFKTVFREIYSSLELKLNQHYGVKTNDRITKKTLIPLGILFSISNVVGKIKLIFDIFKNDDGVFTKSSEFDDYLLSSFLICSYCMISARRKISSTNSNLPELSKDDLIKCLGVCELKDCQNLLKVFNDTFFTEDKLDWLKFKEKFENKENGFQWLLSPKGIRKKLEENNV